MKKVFSFRIAFLLLILFIVHLDVFPQTNFVWGRQFGTEKEEQSLNAVADQFGNVYVAGMTLGKLSGEGYGDVDGFLTKLDSAGNILWTKQFGTKEKDRINWLTLDRSGNVYLTGITNGTVGSKLYGSEDIWIVRFDSSGNIVWQQQYGTDSADVANGIYVDDKGDIFVSGVTKGTLGLSSFGRTDFFILKLDNNGKKIFARQFGTTEDDHCSGITGDATSVIYVCGGTYGDLSGMNKGKTDAFVGLFDGKGERIKFIQFGTDNYDMASHAIVDKDGSLYVGGSTGGDLAGKQLGEGDCLLVKINKKGELIWMQQFGTEKWDGVLGIDLDKMVSGNIVVSGCQHWPECQSFVRMYNSDGGLIWTRNSVATGKFGGTCGKGVCVDRKGNIYHTGMTGGNLFNSVLGQHDIFIVKYESDKSITKP